MMAHHEEHEGQEQANPVQVQHFLSGIDYPTDKQTLLERARDQSVDETSLRTLEQLPDKEYNSPTDVSEEIGKSQ